MRQPSVNSCSILTGGMSITEGSQPGTFCCAVEHLLEQHLAIGSSRTTELTKPPSNMAFTMVSARTLSSLSRVPCAAPAPVR